MKSDLVYLGHMFDLASKATQKIAGKTRAEFDADENLQLALVHLVQMIGESARRVGASTRTTYPEIPFRQVIGMRHKVVHDYLDVDLDVVYAVVTRDLPDLVTRLERILTKEQ